MGEWKKKVIAVSSSPSSGNRNSVYKENYRERAMFSERRHDVLTDREDLATMAQIIVMIVITGATAW